MFLLARVDWVHYAFAIPLALLSVFLILVILVQRGRGGGLTGALGGMGGQSAFGTKAGDLFTRITIVVAAIWILLSMAAIKVLNTRATAGLDRSQRGSTAPLDPAADDKASGGKTFDGAKNTAAPSDTTNTEGAAKSPGATPPADTSPPPSGTPAAGDATPAATDAGAPEMP